MESLQYYKGTLLRQIYKRLNKDEFESKGSRQKLIEGLTQGMMKGEYCMHDIDRDKYEKLDTCPDCQEEILRPYKEDLKHREQDNH